MSYPRDDRDAAHKIPIVPWIDKRLYENRHDGYRFADMPPDREAFRLGLQAIETNRSIIFMAAVSSTCHCARTG